MERRLPARDMARTFCLTEALAGPSPPLAARALVLPIRHGIILANDAYAVWLRRFALRAIGRLLPGAG
jgi:hypothetical protein